MADRPKFISIDLVIPGLREELERVESERAARNRLVLDAAIVPAKLSDVHVGDLVVPKDEQWQRGPGRVDEIDQYGRVWAVFGQRERPHHTDAPTVRCFMPWKELRIVKRSGRVA